MKEYYLKSVEGKIKLNKDHIVIMRLQKEMVIKFDQIEVVMCKIEGPYGKLFFTFKQPEEMDSIKQATDAPKIYNLHNDMKEIKEDFTYNFVLSFERMYENEFKLFKDYLDSYISGITKDFNMLDIITTQEQSEQEAEQIAQLMRQKKIENERSGTMKNLLRNVFFIVIGVIGLVALLDVITSF